MEKIFIGSFCFHKELFSGDYDLESEIEETLNRAPWSKWVKNNDIKYDITSHYSQTTDTQIYDVYLILSPKQKTIFFIKWPKG